MGFFLTVFYLLTLLLMHVTSLLCPGCCYSSVSGSQLPTPAVFQLQRDVISKTVYPVYFPSLHTRDLNNVIPSYLLLP